MQPRLSSADVLPPGVGNRRAESFSPTKVRLGAGASAGRAAFAGFAQQPSYRIAGQAPTAAHQWQRAKQDAVPGEGLADGGTRAGGMAAARGTAFTQSGILSTYRRALQHPSSRAGRIADSSRVVSSHGVVARHNLLQTPSALALAPHHIASATSTSPEAQEATRAHKSRRTVLHTNSLAVLTADAADAARIRMIAANTPASDIVAAHAGAVLGDSGRAMVVDNIVHDAVVRRVASHGAIGGAYSPDAAAGVARHPSAGALTGGSSRSPRPLPSGI